MVDDAESLPKIKDSSIDVYLSPLVLHVVTSPKKMLSSAFRILKDGGKIGLSVLGGPETNFFKVITDYIIEAGCKFNDKKSELFSTLS